MSENSTKIINKILGFIFRSIIAGAVTILFILSRVYNDNWFFSGLIYLMVLIPFQTELIELKKPEGKQWRYVFSVLPSILILICVMIGLLNVDPQIPQEISSIPITALLSIFGFGITSVSICFAFIGKSDNDTYVLVTDKNKFWFIDFIGVWTLNLFAALILVAQNISSSVFIIATMMILQLYVVLHYYIRQILKSKIK
jgi:hypothetical protein